MDDSGPAKAMKVVVILFLAVLLLGGGGAAAWFLYLAPSGEEETVAAPYDPVFVELDGMMLPIIEEDQVVEQVTLKVTLELDRSRQEQVLLVKRHVHDAFLAELYGLMAKRVVREMGDPKPFLQRRLATVGDRLLGPGVLERVYVSEVVRRRVLGS